MNGALQVINGRLLAAPDEDDGRLVTDFSCNSPDRLVAVVSGVVLACRAFGDWSYKYATTIELNGAFTLRRERPPDVCYWVARPPFAGALREYHASKACEGDYAELCEICEGYLWLNRGPTQWRFMIQARQKYAWPNCPARYVNFFDGYANATPEDCWAPPTINSNLTGWSQPYPDTLEVASGGTVTFSL